MTAAADSVGPAGGPVTRCAWAKINLYLHVTGRRSDGYHELDSLIVFAGYGDRLRIEAGDRLDLTLTGPMASELPGGNDNIVLRAARALTERCEAPKGARITLEKQLPVAAGVGGGSADAAAVLSGLTAHWQPAISPGELQDIALGLGADVPVCLYGRPAWVAGIGEKIARAPALPAAWLLLVNPLVPLATADVFARRRGAFSRPGRWSAVAENAKDLAKFLADVGNDLEAPARALAPEVGQVLARIAQAPEALLARMSGSGATCFGLFARREDARAAGDAIAGERPDWWVRVAPILHGPLNRLYRPAAPDTT